MILLLKVLSAAGVIIAFGYYLAATIASLRFARQAAVPPPPLPKIAPRVALLKPLHGLGISLASNIMSFLEVAYPRLECLFAVSSYDDPAVEVPTAMRSHYQFANIKLVVGEEPNSANRKIAKVIKMADMAEKADIFVMSDADISVERDHLRRVVSELMEDEKTGIVTCAYRSRPSGSIASRLEALFVNTDFAPQVILSAAIEPMRHALGATIAIKRAALDSFGGFRAVKDLLADDYYLGSLAADHGWEVKLSKSVVTLTFEDDSFERMWSRQLRWCRTYRTVRPISLGTILTHGPFWALVFLFASGFSPIAVAALIAMIGGRIGMGWLMIGHVLKLPELSRDAWMTPAKDLLATAIWFVSLASNQVTWAGQRFEILSNGVMREVKS